MRCRGVASVCFRPPHAEPPPMKPDACAELPAVTQAAHAEPPAVKLTGGGAVDQKLHRIMFYHAQKNCKKDKIHILIACKHVLGCIEVWFQLPVWFRLPV